MKLFINASASAVIPVCLIKDTNLVTPPLQTASVFPKPGIVSRHYRADLPKRLKQTQPQCSSNYSGRDGQPVSIAPVFLLAVAGLLAAGTACVSLAR